jgi:NADPH:quinone reductase-like Zn-dependent oxidoreductase
MKAITQKFSFGNSAVLALEETPNPIIRTSHDILISVSVANISKADHFDLLPYLPSMLNFLKAIVSLFVRKPRIRGISGAGTILEIGKDVTKFKVGQRVNFINPRKASVMAELLVMQEDSLIFPIADDLSLIDAAPITYGGMKALQSINEKTIKKGFSVLIYGTNSSIGTYAFQLAYILGGNVTAVSNTYHKKVMSQHVSNQLFDFYTSPLNELNRTFDVIYDANGKFPHSLKKKLLKQHGKFYSVNGPFKIDKSGLDYLNSLLEQKLIKSIIDTVYPFEDYKDAHRHVYGGRKTGNVVLKISD